MLRVKYALDIRAPQEAQAYRGSDHHPDEHPGALG